MPDTLDIPAWTLHPVSGRLQNLYVKEALQGTLKEPLEDTVPQK